MTINRAIFYDKYRERFGKLSTSQFEGLNTILMCIEKDAALSADVRYVSYALATICLECGRTWQPIAEYGKGAKHSYGKVDKTTGKAYYGRGFVQCTWKANYQKLTDLWNKQYPNDPVDFVKNPDLLLNIKYAWFAVSAPMLIGMYTGKKLSDFITKTTTDYRHARKIINGMDKATEIAGFAEDFQYVLMQSASVQAATLTDTLTDGTTGATQGAATA